MTPEILGEKDAYVTGLGAGHHEAVAIRGLDGFVGAAHGAVGPGIHGHHDRCHLELCTRGSNGVASRAVAGPPWAPVRFIGHRPTTRLVESEQRTRHCGPE